MDAHILTMAQNAINSVNTFFALVYGLPLLVVCGGLLYRHIIARYEIRNPPRQEVLALREAKKYGCHDEFLAIHSAMLAELAEYPSAHPFHQKGLAISVAISATDAKIRTGELPTEFESNSHRAWQIYSGYQCRDALINFYS